MKKVYLLLAMLTIAGMGIGQTTLSAGDIAIFGVNGDNPDDFGFVLLVDIDAGTEIRFTDSGWKSDNTFRGNEGAVKYTAPTALTAGTEITYQGNNSDFVADNDATVGNNGFNLSGSGDQVFAFQGASTSPTFIYAVQTNSNVWQADATSSTNSAIPQGLTDGTNAAAVGHGSGAGDEWDNAAYDKDNSTMSGTAAVLLAAISNNSNWVGQNSPRYDLTTYDFTITTGSTTPTVSTVDASNIDVTTADMNGNVTSNGGDAVTDRGVCYNTSAGVTLSDNLTSAGSGGTGTYSVTVATLSPETHYYFAAYATNSVGTTLASNELNFWTLSIEPTAHTSTFIASAGSATQIDLSFDAALGIGGDGYIILRRDDGTNPDATGVIDGTAPGSLSLPTGTTLVTTITNNSATSYSDIGLSSATQYNYAIIPYNYNGSNDETYNYKTDGTIPTDNATTSAKPEPTNHAASFTAGTPSSSSIPLTWLDNDGTVAADGFLVMINETGTFIPPTDGSPQADDTDVSDGSGVVNVAHGDETYTWTNLAQSTHYYFTIYPYTNSGAAIDYKTDGTVPTDDATTTGAATTTLPYSQTFDSDLGDCQTYSVSGTTKEWDWNSSDQAAQMNGYNSGDLEEDWLFIPGIDFDSYSNEIMTFDSWYKYGSDDADNYLKLLYSSDYPGSGDPTGYTWTELTFTHPASAENWTSSGDIDLSAISGSSVYIAFKYHYNSGKYRRWEIDNISIHESTTNPEPSNYPTDFAATANSSTAITNTWTDATGSQLPSAYLILIKDNTGSFTTPVDGTPVSDDTDLSDGNGAINVDYGDETYQWTGLSIATHYDFVIYSYTNSGANIDYKTDGTAPTASATTNTANTDLIISEVADPKDHYQGRFVELYNLSSDTIFFNNETWYLVRQANGGSYGRVQLTDTINPGEAYTIGYSDANFSGQYGFNPDLHSGIITGTGDDGYFLYYGGNETSGTLIDAYGVIDEDGSGKPWEYTDGKAVRKRSVGSPNSTWTASEWVITRPADVVNMTPGQHFNYVTWQGTTDTDWDTKANWDNGFIPDISMDVTIPSATNSPVIGVESYAYCWNLTVDAAGSLTIASDATGQGGLYVGGTSTGNVKVNCYTTTGKWHGIAAPVSGQTANALYLNGNPNVWVKSYNESDNTYDYITDLGTSLGTMKGWMIWVDSLAGTLTDTTFTFEGALRSGTVSPTESIVRSQAGSAFGYNFVGNPFTSTIDWDDTVGWTKTNLESAIYSYNDGNWASYINGSGTNGGSRYIAMNQGFFVQVKDDGSTTGILTATNDVQVSQTANFMKSRSAAGDYSLVRLEIDAENMSDETVVKLMDNATNGYDGQYDAHKIFSFNPYHPQIFSTANGNMSINTLPVETGAVDMDVTGKAGDMMTISATERTNLEEVWLVDELTGFQTDLTKEGYSFIYDPSVTNRFTMHFSIVNVDEQTESGNLFTIYAANRKANVIIPSGTRANIEIYNMLGQKVASASNRSGLNQFTLRGNQYYIVKVYNNNQVETKKIVIRK